MTTRSRILATTILLLAAHGLCLGSENGIDVISAENTICDLGHISTKDGPQTCRFRITNNGSEEIEITEAITSCGCTQVRLPESPVAPGETVDVEVTYDNKEVTEFFDKRIALRFKGIDTPLLLSVRGCTANSKSKRFRYSSRYLRFEKKEYQLGDVIQGCEASGELKAIYRRHRPATLEFYSPDSGLKVTAEDSVLRKGDTLTIRYAILTQADDFGTKTYRIFASRKFGQRMIPDKKGIAVSVVSHATSHPCTDGICSPDMETAWKHMALGRMRSREQKAIDVPISNKGDADLSIFRIDGECISGECSGIVIRPGETRNLKLNFEPKQKSKGRYAETLTIYSNDTVKPEYSIYFTYDIKATPFFH